jgi:hypothetical protein
MDSIQYTPDSAAGLGVCDSVLSWYRFIVSSRRSTSPCGNWTSADSNGGAMVGHDNKQGGGAAPMSWNAAHSSKGCSQQNLIATGGNGYFYCFAN